MFMLLQCFASLWQLCWCADVNVGLNAFLMPCAVSRAGCLAMVAEIVYLLCSTQLKSMLGLDSKADADIEKAGSSEPVKIGCICIVIFVQALQLFQIVCAHSYCTVDRKKMLLGMKSSNLLLLKAAMETCLNDYSFYVSLAVSAMMFEALRDDGMIAVIMVLTCIASMTYSNRSHEVVQWCKNDASTWYSLYIRNLLVDGAFTTDNVKSVAILSGQILRSGIDYVFYTIGSTAVIYVVYFFDFWKLKEQWLEYVACFILLVPLAFILLFKLSYAKNNEKQWAMGVEQNKHGESRLQAFNSRFLDALRKMLTAYKVDTTAEIMMNSSIVPLAPDRQQGDIQTDIQKATQAAKSQSAHVTAQFLKPARCVDVTVDVRRVRVVAWKKELEERWTTDNNWTPAQQMLMGVIAIILKGVKFDQSGVFKPDKLSELLAKAGSEGKLRVVDEHGVQQEGVVFPNAYKEAIQSLHEVQGTRLCCSDGRCLCQDKLTKNAHFAQLWANLADPPEEAAVNGLLRLFVIPADNGSKLPPLPAARFFSSALSFVGLPPKR